MLIHIIVAACMVHSIIGFIIFLMMLHNIIRNTLDFPNLLGWYLVTVLLAATFWITFFLNYFGV